MIVFSIIRTQSINCSSVITRGGANLIIFPWVGLANRPLFFSSTDSFLELFKPEEDPEVIIIDFAGSKVIDQSALKAIEDIADKYNSFGKKVKLRHLTKDCHRLLSRAGQLVVDSDDDPDYGIAVDYDVKLGIFGR